MQCEVHCHVLVSRVRKAAPMKRVHCTTYILLYIESALQAQHKAARCVFMGSTERKLLDINAWMHNNMYCAHRFERPLLRKGSLTLRKPMQY